MPQNRIGRCKHNEVWNNEIKRCVLKTDIVLKFGYEELLKRMGINHEFDPFDFDLDDKLFYLESDNLKSLYPIKCSDEELNNAYRDFLAMNLLDAWNMAVEDKLDTILMETDNQKYRYKRHGTYESGRMSSPREVIHQYKDVYLVLPKEFIHTLNEFRTREGFFLIPFNLPKDELKSYYYGNFDLLADYYSFEGMDFNPDIDLDVVDEYWKENINMSDTYDILKEYGCLDEEEG